jgi:hypothetical protein
MEIKINTITSMPVKSQIMRISGASWMRSNINAEQRQYGALLSLFDDEAPPPIAPEA